MTEWREVPGMYIWQNNKGVTIEIKGSHDNGYYVVYLTKPNRSILSIGKPVLKRLSPYFVFSAGYGDFGRHNNARVRSLYNWKPGTLQNALSVVKKYIKSH